MPDPTPHRPLPVLRALIDSVDHEVLQLMARRNGLVGEIAAYKREHRVQIRDHQRERELLQDRGERAAALGMRPEVIESIYRLVLWASRDRQAALKAEVPLDLEPRTVAVVGGHGGMGRLIGGLFADLGHAVMIADIDTELKPGEAAAIADVVVVSVPIETTVEVIREIGPAVRPDALLMDVTSIKGEPVSAMLDSCKASVIGTHPLFGPSVHTVQGQRIVLTPGRSTADHGWDDWLRRMLHARGLIVVESSPEEHDRIMGVVQVLTHCSAEVMGMALARLGMPLEQTLEFTSPVYLMELLMTARHFAQSPGLYASIQMSNPRTAEATGALVEAAQRLQRMAAERDHAAFESMFDDVRTHLGPFTEQALEQSSFLIDRLVERT